MYIWQNTVGPCQRYQLTCRWPAVLVIPVISIPISCDLCTWAVFGHIYSIVASYIARYGIARQEVSVFDLPCGIYLIERVYILEHFLIGIIAIYTHTDHKTHILIEEFVLNITGSICRHECTYRSCILTIRIFLVEKVPDSRLIAEHISLIVIAFIAQDWCPAISIAEEFICGEKLE